MGVEPYLIGAALNMVSGAAAGAAHLLEVPRRLRAAATVRKALERLGFEIPEYSKGMGCRACRNTGFSGRIGIHELLVVGDEVRDAIVADPTIGNLRKQQPPPA